MITVGATGLQPERHARVSGALNERLLVTDSDPICIPRSKAVLAAKAIEARRAETRMRAARFTRARPRAQRAVRPTPEITNSDIKALRQATNDLLEKFDRILSHRFRQRHELQHVDAALRTLDERNEGLIFADTLSDLSLIELGSLSRLYQHIDEMLMRARENRLWQASLEMTGCPSIRKFSIGIFSVFW